MWELYTFWAFVPVMLTWCNERNGAALNVPLLSFAIIGAGSLACACSGLLSRYVAAKRIATWALALSGLCCLLSPFVLLAGHSILLIAFLFFWGLVVIADSPMFSSLVAHHADATVKGTALTIVNCIGFSITIVSIQLLGSLSTAISQPYLYLILAVGPLLGLISLVSTGSRNSDNA
jgi:MFS family permease